MDTLPILGVPVRDWRMDEALRRIGAMLDDTSGRTHSIFFVNAHTLNLADRDPAYREVLCGADHVFGDGTGVRWAARIVHGVELCDNVNGTDLVPALFARFADRGYRYYLLGGDEKICERAAAHARKTFTGWTLAGAHHGYLDDASTADVVDRINAAKPHVLLVGMGNPAQERWIHEHRDRLEVPLCIAVGGIFAYWAGDISRAPAWVRRLGSEWVHLMLSQPRKVPRYVLGNPRFLWRVARSRGDRAA